MNLIEEHIRQLGNSAPIFRLVPSSGGTRINRHILNQYRPTPVAGDVLSYLVCKSFQETFRDGVFRKNEREMQRAVVDEIRRMFRLLIDNYGGYKNAKQSAVFRFMAASSYNIIDEHVDGLVMLYRYARANGMNESSTMPDSIHRSNVLGIIEAMKDKYGQN